MREGLSHNTKPSLTVGLLTRSRGYELSAQMSRQSEQSRFALAFSVGTIITSNIVGGIIAGYLLDRWLGTRPWLVVTGLVLGTISAFAGLYRVMKRLGGNGGSD